MTANINDISQYGYSSPGNMAAVTTWGWFTGSLPFDDEIDHTAQALDLFIEQFEDKVNMLTYETAFLSPYQSFESTLKDIENDMYSLTDATGDRLDIIGEILNEPRNGRLDEEYRAALFLQIEINNSNGEPERVRRITKGLTGATIVELAESFPAGIELVINTIFPLPDNLRPDIEAVASSGVRIGINLSDQGDDFAFDGEGGYPPDANTLGFGETGVGYELEGGKFVEVL